MRALLFAVLAVAGCTGAPASPTAPVHFPKVLDTGDGARLQGLGTGVLRLEGGCLRLVAGAGSRLIIWTPGARLEGGGGQPLRVVDPTTGFGVEAGERIVIGGGEIDAVEANGLNGPIPASCPGPYWLAAEGFHAAPDVGWTPIRATGPFSLKAPAELRRLPVRGIDSAVDRLDGPGLKLDFDYGQYSCGIPDAPAGERHVVSTSYVDQRPVKLDRYAAASPEAGEWAERLQANFTNLERLAGYPPGMANCLAVHARCRTDRDCDVARSIIDTIDFDAPSR